MSFKPSLWRVRAPELPEELADGEPEIEGGGVLVEELRVRCAALGAVEAHAVRVVALAGALGIEVGGEEA